MAAEFEDAFAASASAAADQSGTAVAARCIAVRVYQGSKAADVGEVEVTEVIRVDVEELKRVVVGPRAAVAAAAAKHGAVCRHRRRRLRAQYQRGAK